MNLRLWLSRKLASDDYIRRVKPPPKRWRLKDCRERHPESLSMNQDGDYACISDEYGFGYYRMDG